MQNRKVIYVTGIPRSGSTWAFNVVRLALIAGYGEENVAAGTPEEFARVRDKHVVIKTHEACRHNCAGPGLIIHGTRDYIDALDSWRDMDQNTGVHPETIGTLRARDEFWRPKANVTIKFNELMADPEYCTAIILNAIGSQQDPAVINKMVSELETPKVKIDPVSLIIPRHTRHDRPPEIAVVLNAYSRPAALKKQLNAIKAQSIKPAEILVWQNDHTESRKFGQWFDGTTHAKCNVNLGVFARFAFALNARSEYIAIFDDDQIPGRRWLENCIETIQKVNGLVGTVGTRFTGTDTYHKSTHFGCGLTGTECSPGINDGKIHQVDIVGHCWFFKREWLGWYWAEMPDKYQSRTSGEEMALPYVLQKRGLGTYTAPHSMDDKDRWGNLDGIKWCRHGDAICRMKDRKHEFDESLQRYRKRGWKLMCERKES